MHRIVRCSLIQAANAASPDLPLDQVKKAMIDKHQDAVDDLEKHVDVATYKSFMDAKNGAWKSGVLVLGLKEGGVDYAVDENNKGILTADVKAKADAAKADIISGKIQVHDYMSDNKCPT